MLRQPSLQFINWQKIVPRIVSEAVPQIVYEIALEIVPLVEDAQRTKAPIHQLADDLQSMFF